MKRIQTVVFLTLTLSCGSFAATFSSGDVFASTGVGTVLHYNSAGVLQNTLVAPGMSGFVTGSTFDASGNFYATNFSTTQVYKFINGGSNTGALWADLNAASGSGHTESILFDLAGNAYVGHPDGNDDIVKLNSAGTVLANYNVAVSGRGSDWIDLAADQATMFYTSEGRVIQRFNVATNTQLSNFATLSGAGEAYALRLLPTGGLLVADGSNIKRLDATGAEIQTYDVTGVGNWFALNIDPDGTSFWSATAGGSTLYKFDIASGTVLQTITGVTGGIWGVSVFGEVCVGCANPVPEPSQFLIAGLGAAALIWSRRRVGVASPQSR